MNFLDETAWQDSPRAHEAIVREEILKLESFTLLDAVSAVFAVVIDRAAMSHSSAPTPSLRETAVLSAAVRAFRAIRAASAVIGNGYALEAESFTRMLLELFVSAKAIVVDESEVEAKEWLKGNRAFGIGKRVRAAIPDGSVYGDLSQATHGDPRVLQRALLKLAEGERTVEWGPAKTPQTEEQLRNLALAAREFSVLLEEVGFGQHPEIDAVDQALQRHIPGWNPNMDYEPRAQRRQ
ncbi:MAG TPA: hypothetical protein VNP96_07955 [Solirubrobacterales bacterium]|nr:hypothetical protein [Solirubrobacterales bacterium]